LSKEAAVLKLVLDHPTDLNIFGLDSSDDDLYVVKVWNSRFSNIMTCSGSILFDINLNSLDVTKTKVNKNLVLSFDKLKVENVFSLQSGPIFKIHKMNNERIDIINSEFRSFKGGAGDYLIKYVTKSKYEQLVGDVNILTNSSVH